MTESHRLPSAASLFRDFADRFFPGQVTAVDLEGDGNDEVVAVFRHNPYYPSYAVLFEPRSELVPRRLRQLRPRVHERGIRPGWRRPARARLRGAEQPDGLDVRGRGHSRPAPPPAGRGAGRHGTSRTRLLPRHAPTSTSPTNLLWYALGPRVLDRRGRPGFLRSRVAPPDVPDGVRGQGPDGRRVRPGEGRSRHLHPRGRPPGTGPTALLQDSNQREETGFPAESLELARQAVRRSGRPRGTGPSRNGRTASPEESGSWRGTAAEGEAELSALLATSESAPNIAWEMARALHLAGETVRSARWYAWGLSRVTELKPGRTPVRVPRRAALRPRRSGPLDGGRATRSTDSNPPSLRSPRRASTGVSFAGAGASGPTSFPVTTAIGGDFGKYWALEVRLALGEPLDALARDLATERKAASDTASLLLSLSSEIEARRGNLEEALARATTAWNEVRTARSRHPGPAPTLPSSPRGSRGSPRRRDVPISGAAARLHGAGPRTRALRGGCGLSSRPRVNGDTASATRTTTTQPSAFSQRNETSVKAQTATTAASPAIAPQKAAPPFTRGR